jgi:hypothetical protein
MFGVEPLLKGSIFICRAKMTHLSNKLPTYLIICSECGNVFLHATYINFKQKKVGGKLRLTCPFCDNHENFLHATIEESGEFVTSD